jgi:hypothetical protein
MHGCVSCRQAAVMMTMRGSSSPATAAASSITHYSHAELQSTSLAISPQSHPPSQLREFCIIFLSFLLSLILRSSELKEICTDWLFHRHSVAKPFIQGPFHFTLVANFLLVSSFFNCIHCGLWLTFQIVRVNMSACVCGTFSRREENSRTLLARPTLAIVVRGPPA